MKDIEKFFETFEHAQKAEIIALHYFIVAAMPDLEGSIKWNAPNYSINGIDCITMRLAPKDIFQIILHRGAKKRSDEFSFNDPFAIIKWAATDRGSIDCKTWKDKESEISETLKNWCDAI